MSYVVGLTGGIGSGKSAVSQLFETLGVEVIDTDVIARALTAADGQALRAIRARFGDAYIDTDTGLDRARMRTLAFGDPAARRDLEAILHPLIRNEVEARVRNTRSPYVILVVPLLFESANYRSRVDRVLVVDCDERLQVQRVMQRSGLTEDEVRAIMASQASRAQRLAGADDVIDNGEGLDRLESEVKRLHRLYLSLAGHV